MTRISVAVKKFLKKRMKSVKKIAREFKKMQKQKRHML